VLLDADRMRRTLARIAHEIAEQAPEVQDLALVGIHRRGVELAERLADLLLDFYGARPVTGAIDITFYRDDIDTRVPGSKYDQPVVHSTTLPFDVTGKTIVLVDDVLYTGRTIRAAIEALFDYGRPRVVRLAVLVDRGHRELPIRADFVGKNLPNIIQLFLSIHADRAIFSLHQANSITVLQRSEHLQPLCPFQWSGSKFGKDV
jgi:pyrimidine operon attenuation protein/uracil phosphoribosyltransferase